MRITQISDVTPVPVMDAVHLKDGEFSFRKELFVARYLGPKCKLSRREGTDLYLKSPRRSQTQNVNKTVNPDNGRVSGARSSDYGKQLREKQKQKRIYGTLERRLEDIFFAASSMKGHMKHFYNF